MSETRVITTVKEKKAGMRLFFSIYFKIALTIICALALPLLLAAVLPSQWFATSSFHPWFIFLWTTQLSLGAHTLRLYYLALALLGFVCFAFVMLDIYALYMRPLAILHSWVQMVRDGAHPLTPELARDEVGALGIEISSLVASYMETRELNTDLAEQKSLFTTIMAHQLRTPLTGLIWSIDALLNPATQEEQRKKMLTDVDMLLKRMRLIINHILAAANVESEHFGFVMTETDLAPIVEKLVEGFKPIAQDRSLTLAFDHPDNLPVVYADGERISIALFDLLSNAIDYTPKGGTVTVSLLPGKDRVSVSVSDTGIGIPSNELPLLFNKFYRGENARHMRANGTGLGLYLVKQIITAHASEISVQSNSKGSRFSFYLSTKKPV